MQWIYNKEGPDFDVGFSMTGRPRDGTVGKPRDGTERKPRDETVRNPRDGTIEKPRDGTERKPRDGTIEKPRDGTERKPRDGTEGKPRDKTILWKGSLVIRYYFRITDQPQDDRTREKLSFNWRTHMRSKPALGTGKGEVCPEVNIKRIEN
jgi:hypothetical protein